MASSFAATLQGGGHLTPRERLHLDLITIEGRPMSTLQLTVDRPQRRAGERTARGPLSLIALAAVLVSLPSTENVLHGQVQSPVTSDGQVASTDYFTSSDLCSMCHSNAPQATALRDRRKRPVGPYDLWRTSMMANSSADPIWRAVVAAEVAAMPSRKVDIEAKCLRCHTPMASLEADLAETLPNRAQFLHGKSTLAKLAADGVSCTVCHQFPPEGLGKDESFSGHFQIGDQGRIFGPHAQPFSMPMYRHTGYLPTQSNQVRKSALCAACHTLFTDALSEDGSATGHTLLEQGPYVEWQNSEFNDESEGPTEHTASCQHCHVSTTDVDGQPIKTRIARNPHGWDFPPVDPRQPFGRHAFTGGNTLAPALLRLQLGKQLSKADVAAFDATIQNARRMLRKETAEIAIQKIERHDRQLLVTVSVSNLAGHKLPTAYPSRRVWIRLIARDASAQVVFASGGFDRRGRIVDQAGQLLPSEQAGGPVQPHLTEIVAPNQVQIYQSVMENAQGQVTYSLLQGARYQKDNRLLPRGWKSDHPRGSVTAPVGTSTDRDFTAGSDRALFRIDAPAERGPYRIDVALYYQVLGARYAAELFTHDVPEIKVLRKLYNQVQPQPELLNSARAESPAASQ
jgi:hypothetical protein